MIWTQQTLELKASLPSFSHHSFSIHFFSFLLQTLGENTGSSVLIANGRLIPTQAAFNHGLATEFSGNQRLFYNNTEVELIKFGIGLITDDTSNETYKEKQARYEKFIDDNNVDSNTCLKWSTLHRDYCAKLR